MRAHPHLYEINTCPWLDYLSRQAGRSLTLGNVPDREWDDLRARGMDIVYLMGIWQRSVLGRQLALSSPPLLDAFDEALPGWEARDVAGSAYCIAGYEPDRRIGSWDDLAAVRAKLHERGMQLIVDFIPNHTGFDHPWIRSYPDRYVQGDLQAYRQNPPTFRAVEIPSGDIRFIACGRDPYFPAWSDVAQLDYSNPDTRAAMVAELTRLSDHADGARCDMAMLVLSDVFSRTWKDYLRPSMPATEFWSDARSAVPGFVLIAEVYWDLAWRLQQLGFDFTFDKRLYDRLLQSPAAEVRGHLMADANYQRRSVRFIENHDEPRSARSFGDRIRSAATVFSTVQGLRFFHQGQFEGRTSPLPVQLSRWRDESVNDDLRTFYDRLLAAVNDDVLHAGEWRLLDVHPAGDGSSCDLLAWRWVRDDDLRIVVVNLGEETAEGLVPLSSELPVSGARFVFEDQLNGQRYPWARDALNRAGLSVKLEKGGAHIFRITHADSDQSD